MSERPLENIGHVRLAEAPDIRVTTPGTNTVMSDVGSDEEYALLHVIRLLNRSAISPGVSAVERAFLIGAKSMFEELASTCQQLLDEADSGSSSRAPSAPDQEPSSVSPADRPKRRIGRRSESSQ